MSKTLLITESIQRIGYTVIDGIKVVQHTCSISSENPSQMRVGMVKLDSYMYKTNRSTCRDDYAIFEDAAYTLQEELIAKAEANATNDEPSESSEE